MPNFSDTLKVGNNYAIDKLSENSKLKDCLKKNFDDYEFILDLASYYLISGCSVSQHYPDYARNHAILVKNMKSDSSISNFFKSGITEAKIHDFFKTWIDALKLEGSIYISYDSTNMPCESKGVELAEYGAAKEDDTRMQVNISYVFDQESGIPLFYEAYSGSINDVVQIKKMLEKCKVFGLKNSIFILDRGYFSKQNLEKIWKVSQGYILMAKTSFLSVKEAINLARENIEDVSNYICEKDVYGTRVEKKLFKDDLDGDEKYFYVYKRMNTFYEKSEALRKIHDCEKDLELLKGHEISENVETYIKFFDLTIEDNILIDFNYNNEKCKKIIDDIGYFVIISNLKRTPSEILDIYSKRDCIEKSFRALKDELDFASFGVHSTESLRSKMFVAFISSILRSMYFSLTKKLREKDNKKFTVPAIINALENVEATRFMGEKHRLLYKLSKYQKEILNSLNLSPAALENKIFDYN